jgi:(R)-2-hydroxyacyl-CoA dehydratese activating ATPase
MYFGGCDIGSLTAKAVIIDENEIVSFAVIKAKTRPEISAREVMDIALKKADLKYDNLNKIIGTGYGKELIDFVTGTESEITCHGKGAWSRNKSVKTVIDIGGQDAKAIKIDDEGNIIRYIYNDKCASGTGRFLEVIADALDIELNQMGEVETKSDKELTLSNQCVIFAETEIISLISEGESVSNIIKALHTSVSGRVSSLARSIGIEENVIFTGGVAKNQGVFRALSSSLGVDLLTSDIDPQITGAYGAALIAMEEN